MSPLSHIHLGNDGRLLTPEMFVDPANWNDTKALVNAFVDVVAAKYLMVLGSQSQQVVQVIL